MKYEQPPLMTRQELENTFRNGGGEAVRDALISAFYSEAGEWLAEWCMKMANHADWPARYGAAIVLGNLSAAKGTELDLVSCLATVEKLAADKQNEVRKAARDSLDDVLQAIRRGGVS